MSTAEPVAFVPLPYHPTETYRISDPLENLRLRVTLRKRGTRGNRPVAALAAAAAADAGGSAAQEADADANADGEGDGGNERRRWDRRLFGTGRRASDAPLRDAEAAERQPLRTEEEEADRIVARKEFRWQQKAFAPHEVTRIRGLEEEERSIRHSGGWRHLFSKVQPASGYVQSQERETLAALDREARERGEPRYNGETLFTRVDHEGDYGVDEWTVKFTTSEREEVTPLARSVLSDDGVQAHRDLLGQPAKISMAVLAELPAEELPGAAKPRPPRHPPHRLWWRRGADAAQPAAELGEAQAVVTLVTLRLYPGGRLDIRPALSTREELESEAGGRWHTLPDSRYDFLVENVSEVQTEEQESALLHAEVEGRMAAQLGKRLALGGVDFACPAPGIARICHYVQIESVSGFGSSKVSVQYFALASAGWRLLEGCPPTGHSQMARPRGFADKAVLAFQLEFTVESIGPPSSSRAPLSVFLVVHRCDSVDRRAVIAYAYFEPPGQAGASRHEVDAFQLEQSRSEALQSYFVGGSYQLRDLRALGIPDGFDDRCLDKYGFGTIARGRITLHAQAVVQQTPELRPLPEPPVERSTALVASEAASSRSALTLRGIASIRSLASTATAADRVRKRLEERRERERGGRTPATPSERPRSARSGTVGSEDAAEPELDRSLSSFSSVTIAERVRSRLARANGAGSAQEPEDSPAMSGSALVPARGRIDSPAP